jgi:hypothetical protein
LPAAPKAEDVVMCAGREGASPAVLVATRGRVILVTLPHGEAKLAGWRIGQVLAVEEHREGRSSTVVLLTARATHIVTGVAPARAWTFCRAVRAAILNH